MERGTIKAFRRYLNEKFATSENHRNGKYHQVSREYGDYLYAQDRAKFDVELADAIREGWTPNSSNKSV
jgi:hypothetical protein